jgi:hypothetical protein
MEIGTIESPESYKVAGLRTLSAAQFRWLFIILALLSIIPFWTVRYPLICDYPNHLARWFVLHHARDPLYHFSAFYVPAWGPLPYVSVDLLAVGLQYILPIDVSGRCILSLCIVSVTFAGYLFLRKACPENASLALFGILVAFNPMFLLGSISYEISLAFCLLTVSLWVSYCSSPRVSTALWVMLGLLLTYFSHLIGILLAGLVMGVYALFSQSRWKTMGVLAVLSAPTLAVMGYNLRQGSAAAGNLVYAGMTVWDKFVDLVFPVRFYSSKTQDAAVLAVLAIVAVLLFRHQQRITIQRSWLAVCGVLLAAYLIAPHTWGSGGYADSRVMPFLFFFMLPVFRFPRIPRYVLIMLAALVVFRVASVERLFIGEQPKLQQLTAGFDAIPRDSKVLQIGVADIRRGGLLEVRGPTFHLFYGVIRRGFLAPTLYHLPGVQPIRLVDGVYCPTGVLCAPQNPSDAEWEKIALSYDYLWVQKDWLVPALPSRITDEVFSNEYVTVYRLKAQP